MPVRPALVAADQIIAIANNESCLAERNILRAQNLTSSCGQIHGSFIGRRQHEPIRLLARLYGKGDGNRIGRSIYDDVVVKLRRVICGDFNDDKGRLGDLAETTLYFLESLSEPVRARQTRIADLRRFAA